MLALSFMLSMNIQIRYIHVNGRYPSGCQNYFPQIYLIALTYQTLMFQRRRIYLTLMCQIVLAYSILMYQMVPTYLTLIDQNLQTDQTWMYQNLHTLT